MISKQHTQPCKECPFRRVSPAGYLGGNKPQHFAVNIAHDGDFPCHLTMGEKHEAQCAGRATMWANQCKKSRDGSVPHLPVDREKVFSHVSEFIAHHKIEITREQLMGIEPLDDAPDPFDYELEEEMEYDEC